MFAARLTVGQFVLESEHLWESMQQGYKLAFGNFPSPSEVASWRASLPELARVLSHVGEKLCDCMVYLEFGMPSSSCRADVVVVGLDSQGYRAAAIIELKQWLGRQVVIEGSNVRVGNKVFLHPSEQALGYRDFLVDLSGAFSDVRHTVRSCSFLPTTDASGITHLRTGQFSKLTEVSPLFAGDQVDEFAAWLKETIVAPPCPSGKAA